MKRQLWVIVLFWMLLQQITMAAVVVTGRVTDENNTAVAGASIALTAAGAGGTEAVKALSDPTGAFKLELPAHGLYTATIEREGYFRIGSRAVDLRDSTVIDFVLVRVKELAESIDVQAALPGIDFDTTATETTLQSKDIVDVPYATTNDLKNALTISPGILRGREGDLHINGGEENQVFYTLQGFNITNPLTGRFDTRLSVEGIQSVTLSSGVYSAEYGKGSAGALAINPIKGDDRFRYSATNFVPGVEVRNGGAYIGGWTPRANFSGPIRRSRAWFSNSIDTQYDKYVVDDLPKGKDRVESWRFGNLLSAQVNLTPTNILTGSFLVNFFTAPRSGLGALNPLETTVDRRSRQWFVSIKDQKYFTRGAVLEFGYAANRTFGREIPQGQDFYLLTADGKRGNYFVDGRWKGSRDQWIANLFLPAFTAAGEHRIKVGLDLDLVDYWQDVRRTGYEQYRSDNTLSRIVTFGGRGLASRGNFEASSYITDSWRLRPNLLLELGIRQDWDQIRRHADVSPRAGFAWRPPWFENVKISGGYAIVRDATDLRIFTRNEDQYSLSTYYRRDGGVERGPAVTLFTIANERLATPRAHTWNISLEQRLPWNLYTRFGYQQRRGGLGFTYLNQLPGGGLLPSGPPLFAKSEFDALYNLTNARRDSYTAYDFTVRKAFRGEYMLMANYTRSSAVSNVVPDATVEELIKYSRVSGPMPWDAPNRLLSWGYLPLPRRNWALAYLLEWRDGFPFSVYNDEGLPVGGVNSMRLPDYFILNLHVERRFEFRNQLWAARGGFNNITNRQNPTQVNNDFDSPHYLTYYGGTGRSLNFRIRWLGKSGP